MTPPASIDHADATARLRRCPCGSAFGAVDRRSGARVERATGVGLVPGGTR
jgi:hypothetical protein